ncbi:MAG: hypothetical protein ACK4R6_07075 [Spirosomataceae bacterium]
MSFKEFLISKKINPESFKQAQKSRYDEWNHLYSLVHPASFEAQKKFLLNQTRRQFPLPMGVES